jgi:hypothetical protein
MYEARHQPLLSREHFLRRVSAHLGVAALVVTPILHRVLHRFHLGEKS